MLNLKHNNLPATGVEIAPGALVPVLKQRKLLLLVRMNQYFSSTLMTQNTTSNM